MPERDFFMVCGGVFIGWAIDALIEGKWAFLFLLACGAAIVFLAPRMVRR
jgi:hypothetical protein